MQLSGMVCRRLHVSLYIQHKDAALACWCIQGSQALPELSFVVRTLLQVKPLSPCMHAQVQQDHMTRAAWRTTFMWHKKVFLCFEEVICILS